MQRRAPGRLRRFLLRGLFWGLALLLLLLLAGAGLIWASLPARQGQLALPGLSAPVEVLEDAHGIPRITAANELDAVRALGWLHARDRLFQMELMRRNASGRLAELVGPAALRLDRFSRTLGLQQRADADFAALPAETRAVLEAYAAGVNAWIEAKGRLAAPEFLAIGLPEPWQPSDSLLWAKTMGLWLSGNWRSELDRARLAGRLPPERLQQLWPTDDSPGRPEGLAALPSVGHLDRLAAAIPQFPEAPLPRSASNSWAVAAGRSTTGAPLLANDPHLGLQLPILWYLARIDIPAAEGRPARMLAGATAPGVPFLVIGRNARIAWGFTTTHSDTQDLFVERLSGPDGYETPDGPRPFTIREETIRIRGQAPEVLRVRETRHGPVISDLEAGAAAEGTVIAVAMANLAPEDSAASGLLALNRATRLAEARAAAGLISTPPQNLMVTAADGGIAMYLTGRTPVRAAGDGALPAPGWDGSHDWQGWIPFDVMPHRENPAGGLLVNANNRVQPAGAEPYLGRDWFGDWRFRRIHELLAQRPLQAPQDLATIQRDAVSLFAREALPLLRALPRPTGAAGTARDLLLGWDGEMTTGRPQPLIFNAWWPRMAQAALAAGGVPEGGWSATPEFLRFVLAADGSGAHWCRPAGEAAPEAAPPFAPGGACAAMAATALEAAVADLAGRFGPDPAAWRWGEAHRLRLQHPLLRFLPPLGQLTALDAATPGDGETVNRGGMAAGRFEQLHGPGLRVVFDLSSADGVWAITATGQSGHPLSPHWGDQLPLWASENPEMLQLGVVPGEAGGRLRLTPQ